MCTEVSEDVWVARPHDARRRAGAGARGRAGTRAYAREAPGVERFPGTGHPPPMPATSPEEFDLERALKRDNPKGRLWEACAKRRIPTPTLAASAVGDRHRVQMRVAHGDWELDSGVHWAPTRKLAEHLAARALLEELDALERDEPALRPTPPATRAADALGDEDLFDVSAEDARHRLSNPKGQLLEWCQRQKPPVKRPRFETRALGGAQIARVRLDALDAQSPWFRARRRPEAVQAAAEALLGLLPRDEASDDALETAHPRDLLDRLVKAGKLLECTVEIIGEDGPAHTRVFVAEGCTRPTSGGEMRRTAEGSTKREAIREAARKLLDALAEHPNDPSEATPPGRVFTRRSPARSRERKPTRESNR